MSLLARITVSYRENVRHDLFPSLDAQESGWLEGLKIGADSDSDQALARPESFKTAAATLPARDGASPRTWPIENGYDETAPEATRLVLHDAHGESVEPAPTTTGYVSTASQPTAVEIGDEPEAGQWLSATMQMEQGLGCLLNAAREIAASTVAEAHTLATQIKVKPTLPSSGSEEVASPCGARLSYVSGEVLAGFAPTSLGPDEAQTLSAALRILSRTNAGLIHEVTVFTQARDNL
jgi:hypothetical protein